MAVIKKVENAPDDGKKQQEYLNARSRVKTGIKVAAVVVASLVVALIGGIVYSSGTPAGKVKVSTGSSSLAGENYEDVQTLLTKDGFTEIELRAEGDLIAGVLHKDGDVDTVSIDGDTSFTSGETFDKDAKVVIAYHSYPEGSSSSNTNSNANSSTNSSAASNAVNAASNAAANAASNAANAASNAAANAANTASNAASSATNATNAAGQ